MRLSVKLFSSGLAILGGFLVGGGCCPPDSIEASVFRANGECQMDINYEGTALGVYVIEPQYFDVKKSTKVVDGVEVEVIEDVQVKDIQFPRSNSKFPGIVFFGLDTTTFPDGIVAPVRYGETNKERAVDTKNAYMHSDSAEYNRTYDVATKTDLNTPKYALLYPMSLESPDANCTRCELSSSDPKRTVGPFKIGIVTVPGNTTLDIPGPEEESAFLCPAAGDTGVTIYGTPLSPHFGAD